ncbi:MAG: hypothetical protein HY720_14920 [Planctomycetes bacterium]|nr:hypothetical protein [Planctomycetota bacterium]
MHQTWKRLVEEIHAVVRPVGDSLRESGVRLDPAGDFRFARTPAEILRSGVATGCDDWAKLFIVRARERGIDARMVWMASRTELDRQAEGRELQVDGLPLALDRTRPTRLMSGHQVVAIVLAERQALLDPSFAGQEPIEWSGLVGELVAWERIEQSWGILAGKLRERDLPGEGFVVRRIDANYEAGNSAARNQRIYASGDPDAPSFAVRRLGYPGIKA